LLQDKGNTK